MKEESLRGVVAKVMDYNIAVSEFKLQSRYYAHFIINNLEKNMTPSSPSYWLNRTTTVQ